MSRPKIAHILHLDGAGGGPKTVISQVSYYCNFYDLTVFHGSTGKLAQACHALDIRSVQLPIDRLYHSIWGFFVLWIHLIRLNPQLVILHGQWAGPLGAIAARLAGIRKIIYICQWPSFYTDWDLFRVLRNYIAELIPCRLASRIIAISEGNRYQYLLRKLASEDKILQISNSIDIESTPSVDSVQALREKWNWSKDHIHVASIARLADQKRIDWLLQAWVNVQKKCPQARLWIIGEGPDGDALRALSHDLNLESTCTFLGPQPEGLLFIAASDLVAMTSLYEGHANVPLEALACGKAIVANDVDGVRDSITDGIEGFLVPPFEPDFLSEKLIQLIENPALRKEMGMQGIIRVKQFSKSTVLNQHLLVIKQLLSPEVPHDRSSSDEHHTSYQYTFQILNWLTGLILASVTAYIDYKLGNEISILALYQVPIFWISWRLGRLPAVVISMVCAIFWLVADIYGGRQFSNWLNPLWNTFMRFLLFSSLGIACATIQKILADKQHLIAKLEDTLAQVNALSKLVPTCQQCGKVRTPERHWIVPSKAVKINFESEKLSTLCPACAPSVVKNIYLK
jgi:glycosyltransferase involved in cell wall biosynthesis